jgi:NADH:ubiquinone oxidoreductase subunit H
LHQEDKDAIHVVSWKFRLTYSFTSIIVHIGALNFISIVNKNEGQNCQAVKIIPQKAAAFIFVKSIVYLSLVVVSLKF